MNEKFSSQVMTPNNLGSPRLGGSKKSNSSSKTEFSQALKLTVVRRAVIKISVHCLNRQFDSDRKWTGSEPEADSLFWENILVGTGTNCAS